jgi:SPP1 gp7 family putative phage head morphogenesis protein
MLARTEIIRAYAESSLQEFRNWEVEGVNALCEFQTAEDERVCSKCSHLQGVIYTIDEASGVIPVHPSCRCIWLPILYENIVDKNLIIGGN